MPTKPRVLITYDVGQTRAAGRYEMITRSDFYRAKAFLAGQYPQPFPGYGPWADQDLTGAEWVALDCEYQFNPNIQHPWDRILRLDLVGLYAPGHPVIQFEWCRHDRTDRDAFTAWLKNLIAEVPVVMQNTSADVVPLHKFAGIKWADYLQIDDTMVAHAVRWCEFDHDLEFMDSMYGVHEKLKHLARTDPMLYNAGDVVSTSLTWARLKSELATDPASERIYREFMLPLRPVVMDSEKRGIRVDQARVEELKGYLQDKADFARLIAEAYAGYPINPNSSQALLGALKEEGSKLKTMKADKLVEERNKFLVTNPREDMTPEVLLDRIDDGAHPLLEARASFIQADKQLSAYINPLIMEDGGIRDRVYPRFMPTAQDNGRWSTTNPPLAQIPVSLRDIIVADPGYPWLGWDWAAIELRILAAMARDDMLLAAFENDWDLHVIHCCEIFGYPLPKNRVDPHSSSEDAGWRADLGWEGKDDKRRVFSKAFVYRLIYGGDPRNAHRLPGASKLGVPPNELIAGSYRWLAKHPGLTELWANIRESALSRGEVRDWHGRRRILTERDSNRRIRQAYDVPMQSGCSMVFNDVVIKIAAALPDARFVYGCHDSQYWGLPESKYDTYAEVIKGIADRVWTINGVDIRLACDFHDYREKH